MQHICPPQQIRQNQMKGSSPTSFVSECSMLTQSVLGYCIHIQCSHFNWDTSGRGCVRHRQMMFRRFKDVFFSLDLYGFLAKRRGVLGFQSILLGTRSCRVCSAPKEEQQVVMSGRSSQKTFKFRSWRHVVRERVSNR